MIRVFRVALVACSVLACSLAHAQTPLSVYPNPIQFGTIALNSPSSPIYVYLSNTTATAIDITGITISGTNSNDFALTSNPCVGGIPGNSYCTTTMVFTPSAMGVRSASLAININGVATPTSVPLSGTGGNPVPVVTSISPANLYVGSSTVTVTITGTGFISSSLVYVGSSTVPVPTTYVSATNLKAQVTAEYLSQPTTYQLYVTNPPPAGGSASINLQIVGLEAAINSAEPVSVVAGTNPGPIVLNGSNFMTGAKVQWNGTNVSTTYISTNQLQFQPTTAELATPSIVELTVTNPSPGTISAPIIFNVTSADTITVLDLPANDLVWDPFAQVIYASLPSSYGVNGNSIAVINPSTGAVSAYHFAGSEPAKMALSATSNYLYVGLNGNGSVQRLDLPAFTTDIDINLSSNTAISVANDVKVSPTDAHTIAVAIGSNSCCFQGPLEFFKDSTKLANSVSSYPISEILFPSGTTLFGYANGDLSQVAVSSTGGTLTTEWSSVVQGANVQYNGGLIYSSNGQAFNPATGLLLGTYDVGSACCSNTNNQLLPNSALNRVYALGTTPFFASFGVTGYNLTHFTPVAVASLAELVPSFNSVSTSNLIQWGASGLAFTLQPGCCGSPTTQVVLIQSPALLLTATRTVSLPPMLKSLSPAVATHGSGNFIMTIKGSNFVPGSTITWNRKSVFADYVSSAELRVYVPKALIASAGSAQVVVKNPAPGGGNSNSLAFVIK